MSTFLMLLCFWLFGSSQGAPVNKGMTDEEAAEIGGHGGLIIADVIAPMAGKQAAAEMRAKAGGKKGSGDGSMGSHVASSVAHRVYPAYARQMGVLILKAIRKSMAAAASKTDAVMWSKAGAEIAVPVAIDFVMKVKDRAGTQVGAAVGEALTVTNTEIEGAANATAGSGSEIGSEAMLTVADRGLARVAAEIGGRAIGAAIGAALAMEEDWKIRNQ